ncbi:MAG: hypothetical protein K2X11_02900 [Acetobacteraceae bacterium]|nr:hypothetical protein [Acetobacteraceae bacterium]
MTRAALCFLALLLALPAQAQRGERPGPHDGVYDGTRNQECRPGGVVSRERVIAEVSRGRLSIPGLPGDPPLEAVIAANGSVELPRFGLFGPGRGQIFEGANGARRFTGSHPGRGQCQVTYELLRRAPQGARR